MRYRIVPIVIVVLIIFVGHIIKRVQISRIRERLRYTIEFNNQFFEMINILFDRRELDNGLYRYCLHEIDKIQKELASDGIISEYVDRLHGIQGRNYQLFMNIMPEIRQMISFDNWIVEERVRQLIGCCEDALNRHIGNLDRLIESASKGLYNPFTCFGEGIRLLVGLPLDILLWCGIINQNREQRIRTNYVYRVINNFIVLLGVVSSIVTIALGWEDLLKMINTIWG